MLAESLSGSSNINNISNAFLVNPDIHRKFDRFSFSIVANTSTVPHIYTLKLFTGGHRVLVEKAERGTRIDFGRVNFKNLPNPNLCNLHCAVAQVLHASGAGELLTSLEEHDRDDDKGGIFGGLRARPGKEPSLPLRHLDIKLLELSVKGSIYRVC